MTTCRNCNAGKVTRPRGLCRICFYTPGVRQQYVPTSKFAVRGVGIGNRAEILPSAATEALPGGSAKIAVLEQRAAAGVALWHPLDAHLDGAELPGADLLLQLLAGAVQKKPRVPASVVRARIVQVLTETATPLRPCELRAALGVDRPSVHAALLSLQRKGHVAQEGRAWRLVESRAVAS
jgi:hypothetical protein